MIQTARNDSAHKIRKREEHFCLELLSVKLNVKSRTHVTGVISQDHNDQAIAVGATLAHEMGHNLGMDHDDSSACACSGDSCIMAAALR